MEMKIRPRRLRGSETMRKMVRETREVIVCNP